MVPLEPAAAGPEAGSHPEAHLAAVARSPVTRRRRRFPRARGGERVLPKHLRTEGNLRKHSTAASSPSSCAAAASSSGVDDVNELPTRARDPASLRRVAGSASRSIIATVAWSPRWAASSILMRAP